jgi:cobalt-zinc-cadmium efflux system protein
MGFGGHGGHGHSHGGDPNSKSFGCSNTVRLSCMLALTFSFFIVELIVGKLANSVAMKSDAFHMLSDALALIIGLISNIVRFLLFFTSLQ